MSEFKMVQHIGTKLVKASSEPITKEEYNKYRGWDLPENEDGSELVYLIEYEADPLSKPNHPNHKGYISMSPKHVFDAAYKKSESFSDRLEIEYLDLSVKIGKLKEALDKCLIPGHSIEILQEQLKWMKLYMGTLEERIRRLK